MDYYSGTYPEVPNIEVFRVLAVDRESAIKKARGVRTRTIRAAAQKANHEQKETPAPR